MALIKMNFFNVGKANNIANGNTVFVNGTESTSVSGTNTEFKVKTGLPSITRFVLIGDTPDASYKEQAVIYDANIESGYQTVVLSRSTSSASPTVPTSSAVNLGACIKSISGGEVTLTTSSTAIYASMTTIHWFAE